VPLEVVEAALISVTASVPPWSISMIVPWPEIATLETVRVPTVPALSAMPIAPVALPTRSRPVTVLPEASRTPTPPWVSVAWVPAAASVVAPTVSALPPPISCWVPSSSRLAVALPLK